jgi:hypothetical protein
MVHFQVVNRAHKLNNISLNREDKAIPSIGLENIIKFTKSEFPNCYQELHIKQRNFNCYLPFFLQILLNIGTNKILLGLSLASI